MSDASLFTVIDVVHLIPYIELHILREVERAPIDGKPQAALEPEKMN